MSKISLLRSMIRKKDWLLSLVSFIGYLASESMLLILPLFYKKIIDSFAINSKIETMLIFWWAITSVMAIIVSQICLYYNSISILSIQKSISNFSISRLFDMNYPKLIEYDSEYLMSIITDYSASIASILSIENMRSIVNFVKLVVITFILLALDFIIGIVTIILIIVSILFYKYGNMKYMENNKIFRQKELNYYGQLEDVFSGRHEIKNYKTEDYEIDRHNHMTNENRKFANFYQGKDFKIFFMGLDSVRIIYELITIMLGVYHVYNGLYMIGTLVILVGYSMQVTMPIAYLNSLLNSIRNSITSLDILDDALLLSSKEEVTKINITNINSIDISELSILEEDRLILDNFNLTINRGDKLGIIGKSGAGKSLLIEILLKLKELNYGQVLYNDTHLKEVPESCIFEHISLLSQKSRLLPLSIKDNILLGKEATLNFYSVVEGLLLEKLDLDRVVVDDENNLSGGERARVLLARVLCSGKDIIILDEPLEGIDENSEIIILSNLQTLLKEKTLVVISHRKDVIEKLCNNIVTIK